MLGHRAGSARRGGGPYITKSMRQCWTNSASGSQNNHLHLNLFLSVQLNLYLHSIAFHCICILICVCSRISNNIGPTTDQPVSHLYCTESLLSNFDPRLVEVNQVRIISLSQLHPIYQSLIISREGLILTLPILPCPQERIF